MQISRSARDIAIGGGIEVHRELGPGLLETPYEMCLAFELQCRGLRVERQKPYSLRYRDVCLDTAFRVDLLVEDAVIIEVKAVERLGRVHTAQMISYLRITGHTLGLIFNFNVPLLMTDGFKRVVNNFPDAKPAPARAE